MSHSHGHSHLHKPRNVPDGRLNDYMARDTRFAAAVAEDSEILAPRDAQSGDDYGSGSSGSSSSSSSSSSNDKCGSGLSDPTCQTDAGDSTVTIAAVVGVLVPLLIIAVIMIIVWRRKKRRQALEEAADKHGSLDFGLGEVRQKSKGRGGKKGNNGRPEMMDMNAERQFRKDRGLSVDLNSIGSPYVLPTDLNDSRPSFHSMSRSAHDQEDPYKAVAMVRGDSPTAQSRPGSRKDNGSFWTSSSDGTNGRSNLVQNAQRPSRTEPPTGETPLLRSMSPAPPSSDPISPINIPGPSMLPRKPVGQDIDAVRKPFAKANKPGDQASSTLPAGFDFNLPSNLPPATADSPIPTFQFTEATTSNDDHHDSNVDVLPPPPPKRSSLRQPNPEIKRESFQPYDDEYETYADVLGIVQKESSDPFFGETGLGVQGVDTGARRLSASLRPLPPEDVSDVNPEDRANRIRSFYKEYFDDKRGTMAGADATDYYEDYNQEYLDDATVWDPQTGEFVVNGARPYGEPVTRRAMTPPPRAPPRFRNDSAAGNRMYGSGQYAPGRPRGHSSASGAGSRGRQPKKQLPPPSPLSNLPTPHLLRDDSAIFNANEFAPPTSYKDRVAGRPESPFADKRPYSPSVRAFTPLQSSFDDLRVMPSPHALRKSATFTGLDFAPPPRIHSEANSDAGSIRSGRSNTSAMLHANIRAGAYRVSRIDPGVVGTKNDFAKALKPTWDQRGPATNL